MKKRVLLVEDDPVLTRVLRDNLTFEGFEVFQAKNGQEGLDLALANHPDLILLDLMMPKMDGFQFMTALNQNEFFNKIPIIAMSADSQIKEKLRNTMASTYIKKPLKISALLEVVREYSM